MNMPMSRLMRSRTDKMIAGVSGGIGNYLGIDSVIVRICFVFLAFLGWGLLLYPILWIIMPLEPAPADWPGSKPDDDPNALFVGGGRQQVRYDPMTGAPLDPDQDIPIRNVTPPDNSTERNTQRGRILGIALLGVGVLLILKMILPGGLAPYILPALLIGWGIWMLRRAR